MKMYTKMLHIFYNKNNEMYHCMLVCIFIQCFIFGRHTGCQPTHSVVPHDGRRTRFHDLCCFVFCVDMQAHCLIRYSVVCPDLTNDETVFRKNLNLYFSPIKETACNCLYGQLRTSSRKIRI